MPTQVCMGAMMSCSFGAAPSTLVVLPTNMVTTSSMPAATIMDNIPLVNIMPFGMCNSLANPVVASATAAALGVLTPMPCIPATVAPWSPGASKTMIGNQPALDSSCKLNCMWGGVISISSPGQMQCNVG